MPFFSSSSTSVNEIVGSHGGSYSRKDSKPAPLKKKDAARMRQLRRSITDYTIPPPSPSYQNSFPNASLSQLDTSLPPPTYAELDEVRLPLPRFKVTPRPEEGREILPSYKCSLMKEAIFERKIEMESPFERSGDRKWTKVFCVLNNTVLNLHKVKRTAMIPRPDPLEEDPDDPTGYAPGPLIKSFTLQHAEVGAASDYKKKSYVIRVRAETQQFLLACKTVETFFGWLEALSSGINVALPLEERALPKYQTIPRRRRRRHRTQETAVQDVVQQQEEIIRRHYPQLLLSDDVPDIGFVEIDPTLDPNDRPATSGGLDAIDEHGHSSDLEEGLQPSGIATPVSHLESHNGSLVDLGSLRISAEQGQDVEHNGEIHGESNEGSRTWYSSRPSTAATTGPSNPFANRGHLAGFAKNTTASVHEGQTRKWRGGPPATREQHLRFAKRCMSVLNANTPRQSNFVIEKGIRYEIVPGQYKMIPDGRITLPSYQNHKPHVYAQAALIDL
ncbi:hypothetical protein AOL_s00083g183 [Orbilia oligospora ATCC 24927]|uniref:PH domain-containing protein n=1 Tax=Arthrobotrys oligospora (strain ATCC 24927 / CBS 115.81 / DSM 1491) TaxID=756982 RepID=G1XGQ2_ARTOA|nr:hypothetical protein AOL_s00083g183 [Orbilia oligospora ATCC 24927]EGX47675.1 hypothetical protein AOL_s00083g183 [Orbilia oligospora ATCC 24927]